MIFYHGGYSEVILWILKVLAKAEVHGDLTKARI